MENWEGRPEWLGYKDRVVAWLRALPPRGAIGNGTKKADSRCSAAATAGVAGAALSADVLPEDKGAAGTWQKLLKLQTTASAMHTTAHPDDEHAGVLSLLSRGRRARGSPC